MTSQSNEIDIAPMLNDINKVLKGHLTAILGPMINEKNAIQNVLLNMPYVKNLKTQNEVLKTQIIQLKAELNGLKVYYERELENASKKNVKLEVRDSKTGEPETPSKIVELKKSMWTKNTKVNTEEEDNDLYGESDDDNDVSEDGDDDDDDMSEYEECNKCEKMNNIELLQDGSCLKCLADDKKTDIVEITSNGTVESNNEEEDIKTVTVWNLNNTNKEVEKEREDEEVDEHEDEEDEAEDDEEDEQGEEEEEDEEEDEEDDEEEDEEEDEDDDEQEEEEGDEEEEEVEEEEYEEDDDEEDMEVEDVEIDGVQYLTTSPINGKIFKCDEDGEMEEDENGDFIICGYFKEGIANFI